MQAEITLVPGYIVVVHEQRLEAKHNTNGYSQLKPSQADHHICDTEPASDNFNLVVMEHIGKSF